MLTNLVIALIGALGVGLAVSALLLPRRKVEERRIEAGLPGAQQPGWTDDVATLREAPLLDRLLGPLVRDAIGLLGRNPARREDLEQRLRRSGWCYKGAGDFYANKVLMAGLFFLGGVLAVVIIGEPALFFLPLLLGALGLYVPDRDVTTALEKRRKALYVEMAFTLDRLALLMEAGVAFPEALAEIARARGGGVFVSALRSAVARFRLGTPVSESLQEMLKELPEEPELEKFVQRMRKGGQQAAALRAQADLMRNRVEADLLARGLRAGMVIIALGYLFLLALAILIAMPPLVLAMRMFSF